MQQFSDEEGFYSDEDASAQKGDVPLDPEAAQIAEENRLAAEQLPQPVKQVRNQRPSPSNSALSGLWTNMERRRDGFLTFFGGSSLCGCTKRFRREILPTSRTPTSVDSRM
jgi:hypothetical protein